MRVGHQCLRIVVTGEDVERLDREVGTVRIQRVPRTERQGRVHTSTVTVAVLGSSTVDVDAYRRRSADDFALEWFSGTVKAGGQKHNKTQTCLRLRHLPTGIVQTAQTRSRENSAKEAFTAIHETLDRALASAEHGHLNDVRRAQIGSGQRASEKRRTLRFQEDKAVDHLTGRSMRARDVMRGMIDGLWR